jgi:hypothetical protein
MFAQMEESIKMVILNLKVNYVHVMLKVKLTPEQVMKI